MHELSVAMSVVDVAAEELRRLGGGSVRAIHLKLGPLAGVGKSALLSAYELACEGTALERAEMVIQDVPVAIYCPTCEAERPIQSIQMICCSVCGTPAARVVRGNELQVTAMEVDE